MVHLKESVAKGLGNSDLLKKGPDLELPREREDFKTLLKREG
jgi:hypothetical protein